MGNSKLPSCLPREILFGRLIPLNKLTRSYEGPCLSVLIAIVVVLKTNQRMIFSCPQKSSLKFSQEQKGKHRNTCLKTKTSCSYQLCTPTLTDIQFTLEMVKARVPNFADLCIKRCANPFNQQLRCWGTLKIRQVKYKKK